MTFLFLHIDTNAETSNQINPDSTFFGKLFCFIKSIFGSKCWSSFENVESTTFGNENSNVTEPSKPKPTTNDKEENYERFVTEQELDDESFRCIPGKTFMVDCNRCWCAKNGKEPKTCTRIACNPTSYEPVVPE